MKYTVILLSLLFFLLSSCTKEIMDPCLGRFISDQISIQWDSLDSKERNENINRGYRLNEQIVYLSTEFELTYPAITTFSTTLFKMDSKNHKISDQRELILGRHYYSKSHIYYWQDSSITSIDLNTFQEEIVYNHLPYYNIYITYNIFSPSFIGDYMYICNISEKSDEYDIIRINLVSKSFEKVFSYKYVPFTNTNNHYVPKVMLNNDGDVILSYTQRLTSNYMEQRKLIIFNLTTNTEVFSINLKSSTSKIILDEQHVYLNGDSNKISITAYNILKGTKIWEVSTFHQEPNRFFGPNSLSYGLLKNDEIILVIADNNTHLFDSSTGEELFKCDYRSSYMSVNENQILSVQNNDINYTIDIYDLESNCLTKQFVLEEAFKGQSHNKSLLWNVESQKINLYNGKKFIELKVE